MNSQGLCDGQDLVGLLIFSSPEVFFREAGVCAEGWQPGPLGAAQAAPPSCGARRNGKLLKTERNRHVMVMERASGGTKWAGQSLLQPKSHGLG